MPERLLLRDPFYYKMRIKTIYTMDRFPREPKTVRESFFAKMVLITKEVGSMISQAVLAEWLMSRERFIRESGARD